MTCEHKEWLSHFEEGKIVSICPACGLTYHITCQGYRTIVEKVDQGRCEPTGQLIDWEKIVNELGKS